MITGGNLVEIDAGGHSCSVPDYLMITGFHFAVSQNSDFAAKDIEHFKFDQSFFRETEINSCYRIEGIGEVLLPD